MDRVAATKMVVALASLALTVACTDLISYHMADDTEIPPASFPYALTKTRLTTVFTVTLATCTAVQNSKYPSMDLKVTAATAPLFEVDENQRYYVDYTQLTSFFKSTTLKIVTNSDNTLQSVNTESSDQTLQVTGAFLQTAAAIAGAAFTGNVHVQQATTESQKVQAREDVVYREESLKEAKRLIDNGEKPSATAPTQRFVTACSDDAITAVGNLEKAQKALKTAQAKSKPTNGPQGAASAPTAASDAAVIKAANDVIEATKHVTVTIPITIEPTLDDFVVNGQLKLVKIYRDDLLKYLRPIWVRQEFQAGWIDVSFNGSKPATEALPTDSAAVAAAAAAIVAANAATDATQAASEAAASAPAAASDAAIAAADAAAAAEAASSAASKAHQPVATAALVVPEVDDVSFHLFVRKYSFGGLAKKKDQPVPAKASASRSVVVAPQVASGVATEEEGLVVRQPAVGYYRTCLGVCREPNIRGVVMQDPAQKDVDLLPEMPVSVPQLGKTLHLPLHNTFGKDMTLGVIVGADGAVNTLSFQDNSTIGSGLTAIGGAATAYTSTVTAQNAAITARNGAITAQEGVLTSNASLASSNASFADNALKAQSDCISQAQAIVKAGKLPTVACPEGGP
ncbi:hypothetical protein [Paraburkholderia sp. ZP32-5]|uniref:hypothetical protein n=1 Tax=Paraburkholderia sp. ZP32-5 TaxID=2883245 RepID=UPI001F3F701A|nr:hypothetical protein [Paraburkholderia sp. ZP32-5]